MKVVVRVAAWVWWQRLWWYGGEGGHEMDMMDVYWLWVGRRYGGCRRNLAGKGERRRKDIERRKEMGWRL
ncbi:hypothetical protein Tco_1413799 [Tanacetum coccineum]